MSELRADDLISLDLIRDLVRFNTVSRNSNLELIEYVRRYLDDLGVESQVIPGPDGDKACIYATIGPKDRGGVMLSGHTDVVPVDGEEWTSDPFSVTIRDGRAFGRGTTDMKGFVAIALAHVPIFMEKKLKTPIHLAFSYDEEVGCTGVRPMIDVLNGMPNKPQMGIIGEPTRMKVMTGHKGKKSIRVRVRGHECHSSLAPTGVNAIEYAAELIAYIKSIARRLAREGAQDPAYDVPHTTAHVGRIDGGTALNIVPRGCWFDFEFRCLPADNPAALFEEVRLFAENKLLPEMRAIDPKTGFEWEEIAAFPGLDTRDEASVVRLATRLAEDEDTKRVAYGTVAGLFSVTGGIPCVICGPGDIEQAHKPDEYISFQQIAACETFMRRLADACEAEEL